MDRNQNGQDTTQPFFTQGQGSDSASANHLEPENNLDLTNQSINWQTPREGIQTQIGNTAINAPELVANPQAAPAQSEINNKEMPSNPLPTFEPSQSIQDQPKEPVDQPETKSEEYHIESVGESLDKDTFQKVKEINFKDIVNGYDEMARYREEYSRATMRKPAA